MVNQEKLNSKKATDPTRPGPCLVCPYINLQVKDPMAALSYNIFIIILTRHRLRMASTITGVSVGLGLSCSTTRKLTQKRNPSSSRLSFCSIKMAVSVEEEKKKKSFTLEKSEEAFSAAKVKINHHPFDFSSFIGDGF
jgi:glutamate-1-semialdehyde 2,1-aminomutase